MSVQARSYVQLIMGAVSLWTRPPGAVPVYRGPKKLTPSAHQRDDELPHTTKTTTSATMGARQSTCALERTAGPRNRDIGHRDEQLWNVHGQTNSLDHGTCLCVTTGK